MVDSSKLYDKIKEKGWTRKEVARRADALLKGNTTKNTGMTLTSFINKLNGKREFSCSEVQAISSVLSLTSVEMIQIFFASNVA